MKAILIGVAAGFGAWAIVISVFIGVEWLRNRCTSQCEWCAKGGDAAWVQYCKAGDWSKIP